MTPPPPPFDALWFRLLAGTIVGLALGSFVTMLSWRLPRRMSIVTPRSHCPKCREVLGARDLVPVLSWVASGGRCRYCGTKIGVRYPLIELATAAASMAAFALIGFRPLLVAALAGIVAFISCVAIFIERKH